MRETLIFTILLTILFANPSLSQDSTEYKNKKMHDKINNIVKKVFKQVEKDLGAEIFDDENNEEIEKEDNSDFDDKNNNSENLSLYAFPRNKGIPRNNSTLFVVENLNEKFLFRYNRVEGIFLGLQSPHKFFWEEERKFTPFGSIGYSFGVHRWEFDIGAAQQFSSGNNLLEIGIEGHNRVDSKDHWLVGNIENTTSALLFKFDYKDYFLRKGFSSWLGYNYKGSSSDFQTKIVYNNNSLLPYENRVSWSLFRSKKTFRQNPIFPNANIRSVEFNLSFHRLTEDYKKLSGWSASINTEFAGKALKGDYDFERLIIDFRNYLYLSRYDNINLRLRAATAHGNLHPVYLYELGGISTLPAFSYKEFLGNRLLLLNVEYIVNGKMFSEETDFPLSIIDKFNLILFFDVGDVTNTDGNLTFTKGFENFKLNELKSNWGFAIGSADGKYRLGFAWKTESKTPANVFIRIGRPF